MIPNFAVKLFFKSNFNFQTRLLLTTMQLCFLGYCNKFGT